MGHTPNGVCLGIIVEKYNCQYGHFVVINITVVLQKSTETAEGYFSQSQLQYLQN